MMPGTERRMGPLNPKLNHTGCATSQTGRFLLALVLPASLAVILGLGRICSGARHFFSHPMHHDDYQFLAFRIFDWQFPYVRPVSRVLIGLLSPLGYETMIIVMYALLAVYAYLSLAFVLGLFEGRMSPGKVVLLGILLCVSPVLFWYQTYLGVITSLSSGVLGAAALYLFLRAAKSGRRCFRCGAILCLALSAFAKEDFVLPSMAFLACCLLWRNKLVAGCGSDRRVPWSLAVAVAILAALFLYNRSLDSPFTTGSSEAYRIATTFQDIIRGFGIYLIGEVGTLCALVMAFILATAGAVVRPSSRSTFVIRAAACLAILLAMILPYALLPEHTYKYYSFMWYVWICSFVIVCAAVTRREIPGRSGRITATAVFIAMMAAFCAFTFHQGGIARRWHENQSEINIAMMRTLEQLRASLAGEAIVGVYNPPMLSPWSNNNGQYLHRISKFENRWVVFVEEQSASFQFSPDMTTPGTLITVLDAKRVCDVPGMKIIRFDAQGNGDLLRDCHAVRVEKK